MVHLHSGVTSSSAQLWRCGLEVRSPWSAGLRILLLVRWYDGRCEGQEVRALSNYMDSKADTEELGRLAGGSR